MLQLIDGPEPVLSFLCKTYQVHNIPIGTAQTDKIADEVPSSIQLFYSGIYYIFMIKIIIKIAACVYVFIF